MSHSRNRLDVRMGLLLVAVGVVLGSSACTGSNVTGDDAAPNYIEWSCISPPFYHVDVSYPLPRVTGEVKIVNKLKNPSSGSSNQLDVVFEELRVKHRRTDIGSEGVPTLVTAASGMVEVGGEFLGKNWFRLVAPEQKLMPPLEHLHNFGYEPATGLSTINTDAELYLHGRTEAGHDVMARATVSMQFCSSLWDWACIEWSGTCS